MFGSQKRTPTGQSDVRAARDRQINNLHERVPGLRVESKDDSLFEVQISGPDGTKVMLRVFLPTKFPAERPGTCLLLMIEAISAPQASIALVRSSSLGYCLPGTSSLNLLHDTPVARVALKK